MKKILLLIIPLLLVGLAWGQDCTADDGTDGVELWGVCYSIENTTELNLSISELTGSIPPEIGNLTNLTNLILHNNQLTGSIPSEIGNLTNLTELVLFNNQLTGSIPPEIGNLTNLVSLSFYNNQLTGSIPPEIGNLTNLERISLNGNQLSGQIPESICDLSNLQWSSDFIDWDYSYIYNNQLCPPYPSCIEDYVGYQDTSNCGQNNIEVVFQSDWNLVGLPMEVENPYYLTLFPDAIENTLYSFDDAYTSDSIMILGEGYWLRFESAGNTTITGNTINELTISLNEGWNLISGISTPLNISDIQDPDGIIISGTVYEFTPGGYSNEEIIEPGKGYWLRANNSGNIILISP